jgi:hypothetical protein
MAGLSIQKIYFQPDVNLDLAISQIVAASTCSSKERDRHPDAPKLTSKTVNKLFGGVQTIARWAFKNGMVSDDVQWSDPFATMRLDEDALGGHHSLCLN